MKALAKILAWWPVGVATIVVAALIGWLTLAPHPLPDNDLPLFPGADKLVHALMFATLYAAMAFDTMLRRYRRAPGGDLLPAGRVEVLALIAIVAGGGVEFAQMLMGIGRTGEEADFIADALGVVLLMNPVNRLLGALFGRLPR